MHPGLERVVRDALELCAVAAPPFGEGPRGDEVARRLGALGVEATRDAVGNVLARFGPAEGPAAAVAAHLDTVFPAETPLDPRHDGDELHGPGIGDDTLGLAALLHAARRLAGGPAPAHPVLLAATVGEEGLGDLRGARALMAAQAVDAFVALEGHGRDALQVSGIGSARIRAIVRGPGGHSWGDRGTPSAVHGLLEGVAAAVRAAGSEHVNVGVISGGTSINTIASEATAEIDLRNADDAALEATRTEVERALRTAVPKGLALELEAIGRRPGGATPPDHPLVEAARAARRSAGLAPAEETASSTDANVAMAHGVPAICVGLTHGANAHRTDEVVQIAPLSPGLHALDALLDALAAGL